jgi:tryptophan-rich sensory protein
MMSIVRAHIVSFVIIFVIAMFPRDVMKATKSRWYECIKPSITPPNIVFPIVWGILYILIAFALAQALMIENDEKRKKLLWFFGVNLILNVVWSLLYFGLKEVSASFVVIIGLILSQYMIMKLAWTSLPRLTFWILVPYMVWLLFAGILNGMSIGKAGKCAKLI